VTYVGFMPTDAVIDRIMEDQVKRAGVTLPMVRYPLVMRGGTLQNGRQVRYLLNYSAKPQQMKYDYAAGLELLSGKSVGKGEVLKLAPWGVAVVEEQ